MNVGGDRTLEEVWKTIDTDHDGNHLFMTDLVR